MKSFIVLILFLLSACTPVLAGTEAIIKADQIDGLESVKNYMKEKAHFEKNVNGWVAYADAAARLPVDGTGGAPAITCTRSTTTPITGDGALIVTKDAVNRQGQGCSATYTIDNAAKSKVMQIELDYRVVSGTFVAGSDTTDSDLILYMYDVTNSTLIQPSSIKFLANSTTTPSKMVANFQTSATGTTYNLILHAATTSAAAYVVMFDNVKVTQSRYVYGTPITDWVSWTPTGSWSTNTTYTGYYRRVGDSLEVKYRLSLAGAPTAASLTLNLPPGLTIDSAKALTVVNEQNKVGFAKFNDQGVDQYHGDVSIASSTTLSVFTNRTLTGSNPVFIDHPAVNATTPFTWGSTDTLWAEASGIPITGWASSSQVSDGYNTAEISFVANVSTTAASASTPFIYTTVVSNKGGWYNVANGKATAPTPGTYFFRANMYTGATLAEPVCYLNGVAYNRGSAQPSAATPGEVSCIAVMNAGDTMEIRPNGAATASGDLTLNNFSGFRLGTSQTMSADVKMAFMAEGASSSAAGSNVVIPFNNPVEDTHACWNSTNKDCTVPSPGTYKVTCASRVSPTGPSVNQYIDVIIQIDTVTKREFVKYLENTGIAALSGMASWQGPLIAGQKIRCVLDTNLTSPVMTTGTTHTYLEIFRVK